MKRVARHAKCQLQAKECHTLPLLDSSLSTLENRRLSTRIAPGFCGCNTKTSLPSDHSVTFVTGRIHSGVCFCPIGAFVQLLFGLIMWWKMPLKINEINRINVNMKHSLPLKNLLSSRPNDTYSLWRMVNARNLSILKFLPGGRGDYSHKFRVGVCREGS